jgi:hypothetical protein
MSEVNIVNQLAEKWKTFLPPVRPSKKFLQVYEEDIRKIENNKNSQVLILGATPELRMLALKHQCKVTVVDINMMVIKAMEHLMDYKQVDKNNEVIVISNWLDLSSEIGSFDLILGDGSINELGLDEHETLFLKLKQVLKPHGYVSTKIQLPYPDGQDPMPMLDVLENYQRIPEQTKTNPFSDLVLKLFYSKESFDEKTRESSSKKVIEELHRLENQKKIKRTEFEVLFEFFEYIAAWDYRCTLPKRAELEKILSKHFSIISKRLGEETWFLDSRVYLLESN